MLEEYNINQTTLKILGLYAGDYQKSFHLREIARETGVDVKTIHLQLKRLEKMNILSSTMKGRNKEHSLNLRNLAAKYYMVMAETLASVRFLQDNFVIKKVAGEIDAVPSIVLLFGSFAKGRATKDSDIDLFVITDKRIDRNMMMEKGDLIGRAINIKSCTQAQFMKALQDRDPLILEVVSDHIVLKGVDEFCGILWRYHARH